MPYSKPKDKKVKTTSQSLRSTPGLASLADLEDVRKVASLRKTSAQYLLPKAYIEKLSRHPEVVQGYVRRGTRTSVSPRTLIENLERLCIQVNENAEPLTPSEAETESSVQSDQCDSVDDGTSQPLLCQSLSSDVGCSGFGYDASSLSRRRLASKKPTLDCQIPLPRAPSFARPDSPESTGMHNGLPSPSNAVETARHSKSLASPLTIPACRAFSTADDMPITPVGQIVGEKLTPPNAPRHTIARIRPTSLLTSVLSSSIRDCDGEVTSPYPFTPLAEEPEDSSMHVQLSPELQEREPTTQTRTLPLARPSTRIAVCTETAMHTCKQLRPLSLHDPAMSTPSPLSLDPMQPSHDLASPLTLLIPHSSRFPASTPLRSPVMRFGSPGYFNA